MHAPEESQKQKNVKPLIECVALEGDEEYHNVCTVDNYKRKGIK